MAPDATKRSFLVVVFLLLFSLPAFSDNTILVSSERALPYTHEFDGSPLLPGQELHIQGNNTSDSALILIIRIDNASSTNYRSRFNREFSVQPGPFNLSIPITGLKTSGKQPLEPPYTQMIIFAAGEAKGLVVTTASIKKPAPPPPKVLALDFGRMDSPVYPGFELLLPDDRRLEGEILARYRPSGDPLIQDGFEGISSLAIPWQNGRWRLSLWTQEQGEWEYLPHHLKKKITAEGKVILNQAFSHDEWIDKVYLAGRKQEAVIDGGLWELVGDRRSGLIQSELVIRDGMLNINLEGERSAQYIAGLVLEPLDSDFTSKLTQERQERFLSTWPVKVPDYKAPVTLEFKDVSSLPSKSWEDGRIYNAPRSSLVNLKFRIASPENDDAPVVAIARPRAESGKKLDVEKRYGHWRFERPQPNATSLIVSDSYLRSDITTMSLSTALPRNLYVQVKIPVDAEPGIYSGSLQLFSKNALKVVDYHIRVLPITLPRLEKQVGLYLEPAPFYQWFPDMRRWKPFSTACDLSLLATMGFSTVAPALETPSTKEGSKNFIRQLMQLKRFGFGDSVMAYAPLKRLLVAQPLPEARKSLEGLKQLINYSELQAPYWSIYDEPVPEKFPDIKNVANSLHTQTLEMKTAGHLNHPSQQELLGVTDLAIMNHGYGVSDQAIKNMQNDRRVWLYNMPTPRLAAGAYLWRSGAEGYLQWHARMPTADPFDPTDGREGDVIYLYPWTGSCPTTMNIHSRLLDLHEATLDLRWLQWLDQEAENNEQAKNLRNNLINQIPGTWRDAEKQWSMEQLKALRQSISDLIKLEKQEESNARNR